jgi:FHS family L-fucose permease-like MFS transporter
MLVSTTLRPDAPDGKEATESLIAPGELLPFGLVTSLFFLWGVPNNLNDVLIRQFMTSFSISRFAGGLVQSAFYLGYFLLAIPAALLMRRFGYKTGLVTGLLLFAAGALLFWPAAYVGAYWFFLLALFVIASGLSFLETASNPLITQLGPPATAARRLNIAQAFNPLGSIAGVIVGTVFIFSGVELTPAQVTAMKLRHTYADYLHRETVRVVAPYIALGALAILLLLLIVRTRFPVIRGEHEDGGDHGSFGSLLRNGYFCAAVFAQFMYIGAQVGTWSYFIQYVQDYTRSPEKLAGYLLTGTLAAFAVGRFTASLLMKIVSPRMLMGLYALANIALVTLGILSPGWTGLWAIFGTSFFMSLMFPTIFALGLTGLGPNTKIGGSLLVMAIVGGAVLTPVMGLISEATHSIAKAYTVPLAGYLAVGLFALLRGNAMRRPQVM